MMERSPGRRYAIDARSMDDMESIRIVRNGSMGYTAIPHLMGKKLGWTASGGFVRGCREPLTEKAYAAPPLVPGPGVRSDQRNELLARRRDWRWVQDAGRSSPKREELVYV